MEKFIHIKSKKFPVLEGEEHELENEGTFGRALAEYLQTKLRGRDYDAPKIYAEDWGWWVDLKSAPFHFGVCIYSNPEDKSPLNFVCTDGAPGPRTWVWRKFRFVDTSPWAKKLHENLLAIFEQDPDIEIVAITDEFPW